MPEISRFFGITIYMYYDEHNPPHFHVKYNEYNAVIRIRDYALLEGKLPPKVFGMVMEWTVLHQTELLSDWDNACDEKQLVRIAPL